MYFSSHLVNIRVMVENIVNPEEQDIIFINTAKKFNTSAGQCLIGFAFKKPQAKELFE